LTMSLTAAGSFTGKLALPTVQYSLKGTFSPMGTYASIQAQGSAILNVFLYVNGALPGVSGSLTAETAVATTTYGLQCGLLRTYTAKTIPAGVAGYYTAIMPALSGTETSIPHAPGYGVMSVAATGAIHIDGKLPDGSLFNVRSQLHSDGQSWTFYTPLYGGKTPGTLAGTMTFEKENGSDTDGTLDWIKNPGNPGYYSGGLGLGIDLLAAKYAAPVLTTTNGTLVFSSGNLVVGVTPVESSTDALTISATDKVTVTGPGTTVTITPATGIFSGKFPYDGTELPFGGVFYIKPSAAGYGLFLGAGATGGVEITP